MEECWGISKNYDYCIIEESELIADKVVNAFMMGISVIYVLHDNIFKGIISRKELYSILRKGEILVNKDCYKVKQGNDEYKDAINIFAQNKKISNIPIVDSKGRLCYEYHKNYNNHSLILEKYKNMQTEYALYEGTERKHKIIISLTSYGKRLNTVDICIRSLMTQTYKPDKIILYVEKESCGMIPVSVYSLQQQGLTIINDVEDLKAHKKYYFVMQEYPEDIVITVDDDCIYEDTLVERLYKAHLNNPNVIAGKRTHKILTDSIGVLPYSDWALNCTNINEPSHQLIAIGVGGILYPPHSLDERVFDWDLCKKLSLCADDIWLKYMASLKGTKVMYVEGKLEHPVMITGTQEDALNKINIGRGLNDIYIYNLAKYFNIDLSDYFNRL